MPELVVSPDSKPQVVSFFHNLFVVNMPHRIEGAYHTILQDTLQVTNILSISDITNKALHLSNPSNSLHIT